MAMNLTYYRMVNSGMGYYPPGAMANNPVATTQVSPAALNGVATPGLAAPGLLQGAGLLNGGSTSLVPGSLAPATAGATAAVMPKFMLPNFTATQIQYMFRRRLDRKVAKAVRCETCDLTLNSEQQAQQHFSGKSHLKKLKKATSGEKGDKSDKDKDKGKRRRSRGERKKSCDDDLDGATSDDGSSPGSRSGSRSSSPASTSTSPPPKARRRRRRSDRGESNHESESEEEEETEGKDEHEDKSVDDQDRDSEDGEQKNQNESQSEDNDDSESKPKELTKEKEEGEKSVENSSCDNELAKPCDANNEDGAESSSSKCLPDTDSSNAPATISTAVSASSVVSSSSPVNRSTSSVSPQISKTISPTRPPVTATSILGRQPALLQQFPAGALARFQAPSAVQYLQPGAVATGRLATGQYGLSAQSPQISSSYMASATTGLPASALTAGTAGLLASQQYSQLPQPQVDTSAFSALRSATGVSLNYYNPAMAPTQQPVEYSPATADPYAAYLDASSTGYGLYSTPSSVAAPAFMTAPAVTSTPAQPQMLCYESLSMSRLAGDPSLNADTSMLPAAGLLSIPGSASSSRLASTTQQVSPAASQPEVPKLDPVTQAVYDNMMGKLPRKRKLEIRCSMCEMTFNSQHQADAHFSGSRHAKKQKVDPEPDDLVTGEHIIIQQGQGYQCKACNQHFPDDQIHQHISGVSHKQNVMGSGHMTGHMTDHVTGQRAGWRPSL